MIININWPDIVIAMIVLLTGATGWFLLSRLKAQEQRRRKRIKLIHSFDPIDTPDKIGVSKEEEQRRAQKGITRRFTNMRRTLWIFLILVVAILSLLPFLSMASTAALSMIAGILSVVVGIAARPFLENFICGMVISLSNRLRVGDTIYIDGELGTVEDIDITHTTIRIWNWQRYILPNSQMLNKALKNCTHQDNLLWTHIEFMISHHTDLEILEEELKRLVSSSDHCKNQSEPELWPMELGPEGVRCWLAAWANGPEAAWHLRNAMRKIVLKVIRERGLFSHLYHTKIHRDLETTMDHEK